jgi:hypothetical protein
MPVGHPSYTTDPCTRLHWAYNQGVCSSERLPASPAPALTPRLRARPRLRLCPRPRPRPRTCPCPRPRPRPRLCQRPRPRDLHLLRNMVERIPLAPATTDPCTRLHWAQDRVLPLTRKCLAALYPSCAGAGRVSTSTAGPLVISGALGLQSRRSARLSTYLLQPTRALACTGPTTKEDCEFTACIATAM